MKRLIGSLLLVLLVVGCQSSDHDSSNTPQEIAPVSHPQKITTFLWFDGNAEDAVKFYTTVFKDGKVLSESRYGEGAPIPKGTLMTAKFQIAGQEYIALNGGPMYRFTEAISLVINCEDQKEVDYYWEKLTADGGAPGQCGWLKDKFGLSWQVIPRDLTRYLSDNDPTKAGRAAQAMMAMQKIDVAALKRAFNGK